MDLLQPLNSFLRSNIFNMLYLWLFGELLIVSSTNVNLLYLLYSSTQGCCLLHLIKQNCLLKNFSRNSNLDESGISLPASPSRTNLKLHNISVTPKMVKKVIMNFDLSKASGPDCIPMVVLKNCEPELSYILAELFNKCLKESCFPDCWKVSSVVPVFKNVGERSTAKNYRPVSLLSAVSKVFEKLVNNRIVDHLEKVDFFLISIMVLGLLNQLQIFSQNWLESDRIDRTFNRSGATRHLIYPNLLTGFGILIYFTNLRLLEFQVRYLALLFPFSIIDGFKWFWMESLHRKIQLMLEFLKGPFLVLHFSSSWLHFLFLEVGLLVILIDCMIFLSPFLDATRMSMSTVSFLAPRILCLENAFLWPIILMALSLELTDPTLLKIS